MEICRALHTDAALIILDEPTTALGNGEWISSGAIAYVDPYRITLDMVGEKYAERGVYEPRSHRGPGPALKERLVRRPSRVAAG